MSSEKQQFQNAVDAFNGKVDSGYVEWEYDVTEFINKLGFSESDSGMNEESCKPQAIFDHLAAYEQNPTLLVDVANGEHIGETRYPLFILRGQVGKPQLRTWDYIATSADPTKITALRQKIENEWRAKYHEFRESMSQDWWSLVERLERLQEGLQAVAYDIEGDTLKGRCAYEDEVK